MEMEACRSRFIKASDDEGIGWVGGHAHNLSEPPAAVDCAVPEGGAFWERGSREGRKNVGKGDWGGVACLNES